MNPIIGIMKMRIRHFTRMNPLEFHGSKVDKNPQDCEIMSVTPLEKEYWPLTNSRVLLKFGLTNGKRKKH